VREVEQIAVIGAGEEACAIARAAALAGCTVRLHADPAALDAALARIRGAVDDGLRAGLLGAADHQRALDGILATSDLDEAVTHADLIVDAEPATTGARRALLMSLGERCRASALVATAGAPDELIDWIPNPGRLMGLRVAPDRLDIAAGVETSPRALAAAERLARRLARWR
jgi:3-hydroxybutyryl-CoA dehydrogenase